MLLQPKSLILLIQLSLIADTGDAACLNIKLKRFINRFNVEQNYCANCAIDDNCQYVYIECCDSTDRIQYIRSSDGSSDGRDLKKCASKYMNKCDHTFSVTYGVLQNGLKQNGLNDTVWSGSVSGGLENEFNLNGKIGAFKNDFSVCHDLVTREYTVVHQKATYQQARQLCESQGRTLPMPKTKAENDKLDADTSGLDIFFIGLRDHTKGIFGTWLWDDNDSTAWKNWRKAGESYWDAEPNKKYGEESCAVLMKKYADPQHSHRWADFECDWEVPVVVCQNPPSAHNKEMFMPDVEFILDVNDIDYVGGNDWITQLKTTIHPMRFYNAPSLLTVCADFKCFRHPDNKGYSYESSECNENAPFLMELQVTFEPTQSESELYPISTYPSTREGNRCTSPKHTRCH